MTQTTSAPAVSAPAILEGNSPREATANGALNGGSFAAIAVFGISTLALELLHERDQAINAGTVRALSQTLATISQNVQFRLSGTSSYSDGVSTRIRGALRSAIDTMPLPFGQDATAWDGWVDKVTKRTVATALIAVELFNHGTDLPDRPWAALATDRAPAASNA